MAHLVGRITLIGIFDGTTSNVVHADHRSTISVTIAIIWHLTTTLEDAISTCTCNCRKKWIGAKRLYLGVIRWSKQWLIASLLMVHLTGHILFGPLEVTESTVHCKEAWQKRAILRQLWLCLLDFHLLLQSNYINATVMNIASYLGLQIWGALEKHIHVVLVGALICFQVPVPLIFAWPVKWSCLINRVTLV